MTSDSLSDFLSACDEMYAQLREKRGLDERAFAAALDVLEELKVEYEESDAVPKEFAAAAFDLSTAIYSALEMYPEAQADEIAVRFDEFCSRVRDVLNP